MPKKSPPKLEEDILAAIVNHPEGMGIEALGVALDNQVSRRTLQRRMSQLIAQKQVISEGETRRLVYKAALEANTEVISRSNEEPAAPVKVSIPVSSAGADIARLVRLPIAQRKPVGYNRSLLDSYRPNSSFYLTSNTRDHLHRIGRSPAADRPAGTYARDILNRLLVDLSWASSRLEGNTYSRLDTKQLIEEGIEAAGKDAAETQMILNHKRAIEMLVEQADEVGMNWYTFMNLHAVLSDNLLADPSASGRLRKRDVGISGTVFIPLGTPQLVEECFREFLEKAAAIVDPFEQAFFALVHVPYLQPFEDVNKRVSRLAANIPLLKHNLCPISFIDVDEQDYVAAILGVYELTRTDLLADLFVWAYERSRQRFLAVKQSAPEPNLFRLKYRAELGEIIGKTVREKSAVEEAAIRAASKSLIPAGDVEQFVRLVLQELQGLYEGNIARYQLRPSEYEAWKLALGEGPNG